MTSVSLVVPNERTLVTLGPIDNSRLWLAFLGLVFIGNLLHHNIHGAIVIGIFLLTILTWWLEQSFPAKYIQIPVLQNGFSTYIDFSTFEWRKCLAGVVAFVFIGVIDVSGVVFGMSALAGLTKENDEVPGSGFAFLGVSLGSLVGACMGCTPVIVYVESAAGIKEGGRTGIVALVISGFFLISLFLAPVFGSIPVTATAPVSILVGVLMLSQATEIHWDDMTQAIPAFLTMTLIPFTFSITNGIMFGLLASTFFYVSTGLFFDDVRNGIRGNPTSFSAGSSGRQRRLPPPQQPQHQQQRQQGDSATASYSSLDNTFVHSYDSSGIDFGVPGEKVVLVKGPGSASKLVANGTGTLDF
jgi:AGZA family xanthine/uracil permease-like MFS transporter